MRYRLYSERTKRGLTQEQAAKIVKVTRAGYTHIESGIATHLGHWLNALNNSSVFQPANCLLNMINSNRKPHHKILPQNQEKVTVRQA